MPPVVRYTDFPAEFAAERDAILAAVTRVFETGQFILGPEVEAFEREFAALCGTRHAIAVANGTDALVLILKALGVGPGDEVVTVPNSFVASAAAIVHVGARPVLVDVRSDQLLDPARLAAAVTPRTRAVLPVHLTGRCADMDAIDAIAGPRGIAVVEDAAQAVGATHRGRRAGALGRAAGFSLHPLKNLNAAGDAGVVTTGDDAIAAQIRLLRNHGLQTRDEVTLWGFNSRLDALQAAVLRLRLPRLPAVVETRRRLAARYRVALGGVVECPPDDAVAPNVYHLFVIQCDRRDDLQAFLAARGIETKVHYPIPIHLQPAAKDLGYRRGDFPVSERQAGRILSLPIHQWLTESQVDTVAAAIREFYDR